MTSKNGKTKKVLFLEAKRRRRMKGAVDVWLSDLLMIE